MVIITTSVVNIDWSVRKTRNGSFSVRPSFCSKVWTFGPSHHCLMWLSKGKNDIYLNVSVGTMRGKRINVRFYSSSTDHIKLLLLSLT
jgi:hypothetical protein